MRRPVLTRLLMMSRTCPVTTYALGVVQRFSYALLSGDVVTDCIGVSALRNAAVLDDSHPAVD